MFQDKTVPSKIGIMGKMCSGKTTLAKKIQKKYPEYKILSFGNKVQNIASELFGMSNNDRKLLQNIDEKMRDIDSNVWINYIINQINETDKYIIDDVRYENEIKALKEKGFILIYLPISLELQLERIKQIYPDFNPHSQTIENESEGIHLLSHYADFTYSR